MSGAQSSETFKKNLCIKLNENNKNIKFFEVYGIYFLLINLNNFINN